MQIECQNDNKKKVRGVLKVKSLARIMIMLIFTVQSTYFYVCALNVERVRFVCGQRQMGRLGVRREGQFEVFVFTSWCDWEL